MLPLLAAHLGAVFLPPVYTSPLPSIASLPLPDMRTVELQARTLADEAKRAEAAVTVPPPLPPPATCSSACPSSSKGRTADESAERKACADPKPGTFLPLSRLG